ncbi:MAG: type II CRISPR RNA-guided endonuclease Cas9 [Bacteroidaceae bacterium]|nr:type II CRISPR RNA-guided endonuclease Cas9 [Bacteroidaceae bacterium]
MKKILGLDLGTTSIGWAVVNEATNNEEKSSIVKLGVRVNPLTVDEQTNFEKGRPITTNADRTLKRSMRRNLQRYKLRRENLINCLKEHGFINNDSILCENGNRTTFETYRLRAKAATEKISLQELARVLLMINKKRGYKSSRKAKSTDEGELVDGMTVAKTLYEENLTPGQYSLQLLRNGKKYLPDYYQSDLHAEMLRIWYKQQTFYPDILTPDFMKALEGKSKSNTSKIFYARFGIHTADNKSKDKKQQAYKWRVDALNRRLTIEEVAYVISDLNGLINGSSGYLGRISDRSKNLYFNKQTVGQYLMQELDKNPNYSLKNSVFYRQDYLDEFEVIWNTQSKYHPELTPELKKELGNIIIFYQRPLKSQKGLVAICELENEQREVEVDGVKKLITIGCKVCPKSSPLFQEFRMWQRLNDIVIYYSNATPDFFGNGRATKRRLTEEEMNTLAFELSIKGKMTKQQMLKCLFGKTAGLDMNFKDIDGNETQAKLFEAYLKIIEMTGHEGYDSAKLNASQILDVVEKVFTGLGFNTAPLYFDASIKGKQFDKQPMYQLWHLLYSYEGDNSKTGDNSLIKKIRDIFNFDNDDYAKAIAAVSFKPDYGSLCAKAIRNLLPIMKKGIDYSEACKSEYGTHSKRSLTKEELDQKEMKDYLDLLPKNSLRNPVVEKILNQMINVVNEVVATYGPIDEIRIEMARKLKKSAKERERETNKINTTTADHEKIKKILQAAPFNIEHVSHNDIIRYKLYEELKENGYKTLYSNKYIPKEKLFSREIDIEHIIPQARLFDDSFSNKTLEWRSINQEKSNATAFDYVKGKYGEAGAKEYKQRVDELRKQEVISKVKHAYLLMSVDDIPSNILKRELNDTQYIARKAREILEQIVRIVVPTTGKITKRLREDWQLVNVMQELNYPKYEKLGLAETFEKEWTKRNDHRHHAMDALTIAFTKQSIIQYLNNLNARSDKSSSIYGIEQNELYRDKHGTLRFLPPIPLDEFRTEAKLQLEQILVSIKSKTKVVTRNTNKSKSKKAEKGYNKRVQLTPRGQLHNETIYGSSQRYVTKEEKVGSSFDVAKISTVANKAYREALQRRLDTYNGDVRKAFTGKNSLEKTPIWLDDLHTRAVPIKVKCVTMETIYTIRKPISKDLRIDKVIDKHIQDILRTRLEEYEGDANKAFSNLDENPIWLNEEKGIRIKSVAINAGLSKPEAIHEKRNHRGQLIFNEKGNKQAADFVQTANNHHVAIFRNAEGKLQEHIVSFYEASMRANQGLPIIDKEYNKAEGWEFLFTMKQNEYFVFPDKNFCPSEYDLMNPTNYAIISPHLFRVQKLTTKDYFFRHHLETTVEDKNELREMTWKRIQNCDGLKGIVKVRVNHIGQIVAVGES